MQNSSDTRGLSQDNNNKGSASLQDTWAIYIEDKSLKLLISWTIDSDWPIHMVHVLYYLCFILKVPNDKICGGETYCIGTTQLALRSKWEMSIVNLE
jgi:hypothetical protein